MEPETAQMLLAGITTLGVIVWLTGLRFLVRSFAAGKGQAGTTDEGILSSPAPKNWVVGSAVVDGTPAELTARAASLLARGSLATFGPLKVLEKSDDRLVFEKTGPAPGRQPAGRWFQRGELRFVPAGQGRTRMEWIVQLADRRWLLWLGALFQLLGLAALLVGSWLIYAYVVSALNPGVRWQTFQMLQAGHFLWPVFLFAGLYRRARSEVAAQFEALAHNLPYSGD